MKRLSFIILIAAIVFPLQAQLPTNAPKTIPAFDILQTDGSHFKASELKKDQPVMLVYFDPDCDHCTIFIRELVKKIEVFKNVQIVMVTYVPVPSLKTFVKQVGLLKYPQIKVGTEENTFVVRYHYNVVQFPYLALHDRNGMLIATYESEVPAIETLALKFNNQ